MQDLLNSPLTYDAVGDAPFINNVLRRLHDIYDRVVPGMPEGGLDHLVELALQAGEGAAALPFGPHAPAAVLDAIHYRRSQRVGVLSVDFLPAETCILLLEKGLDAAASDVLAGRAAAALCDTMAPFDGEAPFTAVMGPAGAAERARFSLAMSLVLADPEGDEASRMAAWRGGLLRRSLLALRRRRLLAAAERAFGGAGGELGLDVEGFPVWWRGRRGMQREWLAFASTATCFDLPSVTGQEWDALSPPAGEELSEGMAATDASVAIVLTEAESRALGAHEGAVLVAIRRDDVIQAQLVEVGLLDMVVAGLPVWPPLAGYEVVKPSPDAESGCLLRLMSLDLQDVFPATRRTSETSDVGFDDIVWN